MQILLSVICVFCLVGCQTIRMKYESVVEVQGQEEKIQFTYIKSYPVGGNNVALCWLTGLAFGGSCWSYRSMPTAEQKSPLIEDAHSYLLKKYQNQIFEEDRIKVTRVNFQKGEEEVVLIPKESPAADKTQGNVKP